MCLILFTIQPGAEYELVVAANRDEMYARPTRTAEFWEDYPDLLAGKDLEMGGTWLGITRSGRFAAVTNFRETPLNPAPPQSRGDLTRKFLSGTMKATDYLEDLKGRGHLFKGFNLLIGDHSGYYYFSNRDPNAEHDTDSVVVPLQGGFYGLSNQLLNCDWPKVTDGKKKMKDLSKSDFDSEELFNLLFDKGDDLAFSASFIGSSVYGTCASSLLKIRKDGSVTFEERNFSAGGQATETNKFAFTIGGR